MKTEAKMYLDRFLTALRDIQLGLNVTVSSHHDRSVIYPDKFNIAVYDEQNRFILNVQFNLGIIHESSDQFINSIKVLPYYAGILEQYEEDIHSNETFTKILAYVVGICHLHNTKKYI